MNSLTLATAKAPFSGSLMELLNLIAGTERFRLQSAPFLGEILTDGGKRIDVKTPVDGEKLETETGIGMGFQWEAETGRLIRIFCGSKWTGPLVSWEASSGKWFACFGNGNHGKNISSGGNWSGVANVNDSMRPATEEERAAGRGALVRTGVADGMATLSEALEYRFGPTRNRDRKFTESTELVEHVKTVLLGML